MPESRLFSIQREYEFWLEVLGDHARFIAESVVPGEERRLAQAREFESRLRGLGEEARSARLQPVLATSALQSAMGLTEFKQELLNGMLEGTVHLHLSPNLLNHMIAEAEQFLQVQRWLAEGKLPPPSLLALHQHSLWLSDAAGHAAALHDRFDPTEAELRHQAQYFEQLFLGLHNRAFELQRMLRRSPHWVPALTALGQVAGHNIRLFSQWLEGLHHELAELKIMGTARPPLVDHMLREEVYYLEKVAALEQLAH